MFTDRVARKDLARYRKRGLDRLERRMVDSASAEGLAGARVLEIGGGIGKLQVELLEAGAATGEVAELVGAYEPYAGELAREHGLEERTAFAVADILEQPDAVAPGDVVVLNRVVCCSPDGVALAAAAARLARRTLVLSYPRDVVWIRLGVRAINLVQLVLGRSFRVFVHSPAALRAAAESEGFARSEAGHGSLWEFTTLVRSAEEGAF
jgi:magnesium-protoporphyrin O-methyltransferase